MLRSHRILVKRDLLLIRSFLADSLSVLSSYQISQGQGSPGVHSITGPGAKKSSLWRVYYRQGDKSGWCDTPLDKRRDPLGCVPSTSWDPSEHWGQQQLGSGEGILNGQGLSSVASGGTGKRVLNPYLKISDNHWVLLGLWLQVFLIWSIFGVLIEFVPYCFHFMFWFFDCKACGIITKSKLTLFAAQQVNKSEVRCRGMEYDFT